MRLLTHFRRCAWPLGVALLSLLLWAGCATHHDPINPSQPWLPPSVRVEPRPEVAPVGTQQRQMAAEPGAEVLQPQLLQSFPAPQPEPEPETPPGSALGTLVRVGTLLRVSFNDVIPQPPPYDVQVRDDGTIGLPLNVRITAVGKTARELEDLIHQAYVPKYYKILSVNVAVAELYYFVGGEVKLPSKQPYSGPISVVRAIDTAGGFTDFAKKSRIELRRSNGEILRVDYNKARRNPEADAMVYPGDQVLVPKRGPLGF